MAPVSSVTDRFEAACERQDQKERRRQKERKTERRQALDHELKEGDKERERERKIDILEDEAVVQKPSTTRINQDLPTPPPSPQMSRSELSTTSQGATRSSSTSRLDELQVELEDLRQQISNLEGQLKNVQAEVNAHEEQYKEKEKEYTKVVDLKDERIEHLEIRMHSVQQLLKEALGRKHEVENQLAEANAQKHELAEKIESAEQELAEERAKAGGVKTRQRRHGKCQIVRRGPSKFLEKDGKHIEVRWRRQSSQIESLH